MRTNPRIRSLLEAAGVWLVRAILRLIPLRWVHLPGMALGWVLFSVFRLQRRQTVENLSIAFGERHEAAARERLAARCYMHFGTVIAEFLALPRLRGERLAARTVLENPELLEEERAHGKGVLLVSGHLGNWEVMGAAIAGRGVPITLYVGQQHNPLTDGMLNATRRAMGEATVPKQSAMRGMIKALRANQIVGMLPDQHFSRNRHFIRFFGRPVSTAPGPAMLVRHTRASLVFGECIREGPLRHRVRFSRIPLPAPSGQEELDLLRISQAISDALEAAIRRHPEQYFWMHRRWRQAPRPEWLSETNRAFLAGETERAGTAGGGGFPAPAVRAASAGEG